MKTEPKLRIRTYTAYAVETPFQYSDDILRIRPSAEAPEGLAVFESYANAKWFTDIAGLKEDNIFPITIVRSDGRTVPEVEES